MGECCLGLLHRPASVVIRISLILGALVGNFPDHFVDSVAARKGASCIGPIHFGLAPASRWH